MASAHSSCLHGGFSTGFDTLFNSLEPIPQDRVEVSISRKHQRLSAPSIDSKAIDETWEKLTQPVCVERPWDGTVDSKSAGASMRQGQAVPLLSAPNGSPLRLTVDSLDTHRKGSALVSPQSDCGIREDGLPHPRLPSGLNLLALAMKTAAHTGIKVDLPSANSLGGGEESSSSSISGATNCATTADASRSPAAAERADNPERATHVLFNGLKFRLHDCEIYEGGAVAPTVVGSEGERATPPLTPSLEAAASCVSGAAMSAQNQPQEVQPSVENLRVQQDRQLEDIRLLNSNEEMVDAVILDTGTATAAPTSSNGCSPRLHGGNDAQARPARNTASTPATRMPTQVSNVDVPDAGTAHSRPLSSKSSFALAQTVPTTPAHWCTLASAAVHTDANSSTDVARSDSPTACVAKPKSVLLCKLKLGITDYKTSIGTTRHVARYEHYVSRRDKDIDILFGTAVNNGSEDNPISTAEDGDCSSLGGNRRSPATPEGGSSIRRSLSMTLRSEEVVSRSAFIVRRTERYLSNALGVEAMTITSDNCAVLFRRSMEVSEFPGYYCCPGGHPEPSHIFNVKSFTDAQNNNYSSDLRQDRAILQLEACDWFHYVSSEVVVEELFRSVEAEIAEEIGVPRLHCTNRGLVSIVRHAKNRKPDMCFLVDVACTSKEVARIFNQRTALEAFESQEGSLVFMDLDHVKTVGDVVAFIQSRLGGKVTPASCAALLHGIQCLVPPSSP